MHDRYKAFVTFEIFSLDIFPLTTFVEPTGVAPVLFYFNKMVQKAVGFLLIAVMMIH